jgi:hypothetical protein
VREPFLATGEEALEPFSMILIISHHEPEIEVGRKPIEKRVGYDRRDRAAGTVPEGSD